MSSSLLIIVGAAIVAITATASHRPTTATNGIQKLCTKHVPKQRNLSNLLSQTGRDVFKNGPK